MRPARYYPALDGLRGVAVILIVIVHTGLNILQLRTGVESSIQNVIDCFWVGVDLFFALSGFLITNILLDSQRAENRFLSFYARRALRIFPAYFLFLFLFLDFHRPAVSSPWLYVFYIENWTTMIGPGRYHVAHLWSLAIEEQFYLAWPMAVFFLSRKALVRLAVVALVGANGARIAIALLYPSPGLPSIQDAYFWTPTHIDGLILGSLVAIGLRDADLAPVIRRVAWPCIALSALCLAILFYQNGNLLNNPSVLMVGFPAVAIGSAALVVILSERQTCPAILTSVGKYSYGMYLIHNPLVILMGLLKPAMAPFGPYARLASYAAITALAIVLSYSLAWLSWHLMEKHFHVMKGRFKPRYPTGALRADAAAKDFAVVDQPA